VGAKVSSKRWQDRSVVSNIRNPIANNPPLGQNLRGFHPSYARSLFHGSSRERAGALVLMFIDIST
jgi:hypothetical protein